MVDNPTKHIEITLALENSSSIWTSVITTLISAIVGALLTLLLTWLFKWREERKQDEMFWNAAKKEITINYKIAKESLSVIKKESSALKDDKDSIFSIIVLNQFKMKFLDSIQYKIPKTLKNNSDLFAEVNHINLLFADINNQNQGREIYKMNSLGLTNRRETIGKYNDVIKDVLGDLIFIIEKNYDEFIL